MVSGSLAGAQLMGLPIPVQLHALERAAGSMGYKRDGR